MGTPVSQCCLGHWALETMNECRDAEMIHPQSDARVIYTEHHEDHRWDRIEVDRYGQETAAAELYSLREVFEALYQDETEGFQAIVDGQAVVL